MKKVQMATFMQEGSKQVLRFIVAPQQFPSNETATEILAQAVEKYQLECGKPYITCYNPGNPFVVYIIHGINE